MKKSWIFILTLLLYLGMHIYFAYYAFTAFKLWFAVAVTLAPIVGDLLLAGAAIADKNWLPIILLVSVGALYEIGDSVAKKSET